MAYVAHSNYDDTNHGLKSTDDLVIEWLQESFEERMGETIARDVLYDAYTHYCEHTLGVPPMNPASLGKLLRGIFPNISTRRLGSRGQSKYHYSNMGMKSGANVITASVEETPSSPDVSRPRTTHNIMSSSTHSLDHSNSEATAVDTPSFDETTHLGAVGGLAMGQASAQSLPSQPDALTEKIGTLSMMYQNYMQRISNMIYSNQLNGVEEAVAEFWMNFPKDSLDMLENEEFVRQIEIYDTLFFSSILNSIETVLLEEIHPQLSGDLHKLSNEFGNWLQSATESKIPQQLMNIILKGCWTFSESLQHRLRVNEYTCKLTQALKIDEYLVNIGNILGGALDQLNHDACNMQLIQNMLTLFAKQAQPNEWANLVCATYMEHLGANTYSEESFKAKSSDFLQTLSMTMETFISILPNYPLPTETVKMVDTLRSFLVSYAYMIIEKSFVQNFGMLTNFGVLATFINPSMVCPQIQEWRDLLAV